MAQNRRILLRRRPEGMPQVTDFELVEEEIPPISDGEILVQNRFLTLDPYYRGKMNDAKSYTAPAPLNEVMFGQTVSQVVESRDARFAQGDFVLGFGHWQDFAVLSGEDSRKLDPNFAPVSTALGILGMPGRTAYVGLLDFGRPKAGETVVVSAASGAVGSVAGQIAKIKGCRVVGIAGSADKCRYVVEELGFDECVNHRVSDFAGQLARACPQGIDIDFENVGGPVLAAIWPLLNDHARVVVCGLIADYNQRSPSPGPEWRTILMRRITVQGFIITDHFDRNEAFLAEVSEWIRNGKIKYREDIVNGLEKAPEAFIGLLQGHNFGKLLVQISAA